VCLKCIGKDLLYCSALAQKEKNSLSVPKSPRSECFFKRAVYILSKFMYYTSYIDLLKLNLVVNEEFS
jgi:hypothetical protein